MEATCALAKFPRSHLNHVLLSSLKQQQTKFKFLFLRKKLERLTGVLGHQVIRKKYDFDDLSVNESEIYGLHFF